MHQLYDGLYDVILKLLKTAEAREKVLQYLADVIQKNANRVQIQVFLYSDSCQVSTPMFSFLA
jgi:ubiquitin conjugation factor E4 B